MRTPSERRGLKKQVADEKTARENLKRENLKGWYVDPPCSEAQQRLAQLEQSIRQRWEWRKESRTTIPPALGDRLADRARWRSFVPLTEFQRQAFTASRATYGGTTAPWCLLLSGQTGVGKSMLLAARFAWFVRHGFDAKWVTEAEIYDRWLAAPPFHTEGKRSKSQIMDRLARVDFLFIDDLGTSTSGKEAWNAAIDALLCERERRGLATFISTNLDGNGIAALYSNRVRSRLNAGVCVNVVGPDGRRAAA